MYPLTSHRLIHNYEGEGQYNTNRNICFLCFDLLFIKLLINPREKKICLESNTAPLLTRF